MPLRPISIRNESPHPAPDRLIRKAVRAALADSPPGGVSILLADDTALRDLNRQFRSLDEPTDVLTFPAPTGLPELGDIAISWEFARIGADRRGVDISNELAMLAIHGALHLIGYDDTTENERDEMVTLMHRIAESIGLDRGEDWHSVPHGSPA